MVWRATSLSFRVLICSWKKGVVIDQHIHENLWTFARYKLLIGLQIHALFSFFHLGFFHPSYPFIFGYMGLYETKPQLSLVRRGSSCGTNFSTFARCFTLNQQKPTFSRRLVWWHGGTHLLVFFFVWFGGGPFCPQDFSWNICLGRPVGEFQKRWVKFVSHFWTRRFRIS